MYYLSKETAVQAFNSLIGKVENKFLGLLGILKNIKSEPTLKSKDCLKCLYFTKIISALCCYLEYFSYLYTIN